MSNPKSQAGGWGLEAGSRGWGWGLGCQIMSKNPQNLNLNRQTLGHSQDSIVFFRFPATRIMSNAGFDYK